MSDLFEETEQFEVLPCLHTFCLECLISYDKKHKGIDRSLCPVCRSAFTVPEGGYSQLKKNLFIDKMIGAGRELPDQILHVICEVCENQPGEAAQFYCEVCAQNMCEQCCKVHGRINMSKSHRVATLSNEDNMNIETTKPGICTCEKHKQEIKFYCNDCDKTACSYCLLSQHEKHQISDVEIIAEELRKNVQSGCETIDSLLENTEKRLKNSKEMLSEFLKTARIAEKNIVEKGEAIKQYVDKNVSMLLDSVRVHKMKIQDDVEKEYDQVQRNQSVLVGLRNYYEQIVQSADINDLLSVRDDIRTQVGGLIEEIGAQVETSLTIDFIPTDCPITEDEDRMTNPQRNIIGSICGEYNMRMIS